MSRGLFTGGWRRVRMSTIVLIAVFVGAATLYLAVRPGPASVRSAPAASTR